MKAFCIVILSAAKNPANSKTNLAADERRYTQIKADKAIPIMTHLVILAVLSPLPRGERARERVKWWNSTPSFSPKRESILNLKGYFFALRRDALFCLSKKYPQVACPPSARCFTTTLAPKYPNKKTPHTTAYGYLALLINKGVCGTRCAQTVLDEIPFIDCVARHGARG